MSRSQAISIHLNFPPLTSWERNYEIISLHNAGTFFVSFEARGTLRQFKKNVTFINALIKNRKKKIITLRRLSFVSFCFQPCSFQLGNSIQSEGQQKRTWNTQRAYKIRTQLRSIVILKTFKRLVYSLYIVFEYQIESTHI